MNTIVAKFYLWKEQIKALYASGGTLIAIVASVLLVAVGLPLQIGTHGGMWYIIVLSGLSGALITTLIENLTVKGCAALRTMRLQIKEVENANAELQARTLLELEQQGLPAQLPVGVKEVMQYRLKEAKQGSKTAYLFIGLGVLASIAGNGLFWDAILSSLPWFYIVGVTAIFSFVIPTILIDSELRADLHKGVIADAIHSSSDMTIVAQDADARSSLHQRLHEEGQEHLKSSATKSVLQQAATTRVDVILDELLGQSGAASAYRTQSGRTRIVEARALQQLSLGYQLPLMLPAPSSTPAEPSNTDKVLEQLVNLTSALHSLTQQQATLVVQQTAPVLPATPEPEPVADRPVSQAVQAEPSAPESTPSLEPEAAKPVASIAADGQLVTLIEAALQKFLRQGQGQGHTQSQAVATPAAPVAGVQTPDDANDQDSDQAEEPTTEPLPRTAQPTQKDARATNTVASALESKAEQVQTSRSNDGLDLADTEPKKASQRRQPLTQEAMRIYKAYEMLVARGEKKITGKLLAEEAQVSPSTAKTYLAKIRKQQAEADMQVEAEPSTLESSTL